MLQQIGLILFLISDPSAMTTALRKASPTRFTTEPSFNDVVTNTTSSWHGIDNVTGLIRAPEGCLVVPYATIVPQTNPEDLVSFETQRYFNDFVDVYLLALCFLISVPTNVINMAVFWKHGIKERINLCLFCLSVVDLILVVSCFTMKADRIYEVSTNYIYKVVLLPFFIKSFLVYIPAGFVYVSGFLSTLIAVERCVCVVSPLTAQTMIKTKTTAAIIAIAHVVILAGTFIVVSRFTVGCIFDPITGISMDTVIPSEFFHNNRELVDIFSGLIYGIFVPGIYISGVIISTVVTILKLRQMAEWREQSSTASFSSGVTAVKDMSVTKMLIGTSCVFAILIAPRLLFYATLPFIPELALNEKYNNTYNLVMGVQMMCIYINSSVNFFVYYFFGTKFRLTVQGMFHGLRSTKSRARTTSGTKVGEDYAASFVSSSSRPSHCKGQTTGNI